MVDRDRNILGIDTNEGGAITTSADFNLVAKINQKFTDTQSQWTAKTLEFDYGTNATDVKPAKFNIIFSAGDYFTTTVKADELDIDEVQLLYYSQLNSLAVNGTPVAGFSPDTYAYTVDADAMPTAADISYALKGRAANATVSVDDAAHTATVAVTNADDPSSQHTYTVNFNLPAVEPQGPDFYLVGAFNSWTTGDDNYKLAYTGQTTANNEKVYTIELPSLAGEFKICGKTWDDPNFGTNTDNTVAAGSTYQAWPGSSNNFNATATIEPCVLTFYYNADATPSYLKIETYQAYSGKLTIYMLESYINEGGIDGQAATIRLTPAGDGKVNFSLPNFELSGIGNLGTIRVPDVTVTVKGDEKHYAGTVNDLTLPEGVPADEAIHAKVTLNGWINEVNGDIDMQINVDWIQDADSSMPIAVHFFAGAITSGITDLNADNDADAPTEYYNLQGMRIDNPTRGQVVIARQGQKTVKQLVK